MRSRAFPQVDGRLYLSDLSQPATVRRDRWGICYIIAANRADLFVAQGFVHAQDRLWQMELNRRAANGTLSELFGRRTLNSDRLSRTLGFARLAQSSLSALSEQAQLDLAAYSAGINAYLETKPKRPLEFVILNHHAEPWRVLDSLAYGRLQMWALTTGASGELAYAQLIEKIGAEQAKAFGLRYPSANPVTLPWGVEINALKLDKMMETAVAPFLGKGSGKGEGRGSNGWVIAPQRSQTGRPLLANDMHLPVAMPSHWHIQHLQSADGFKVAGFTQPGLPYVMVGHNEQFAWGATMAYTDCEDLFLERFDGERPYHYACDGRWHQADVQHEIIHIRASKPHTETVIHTQNGPLIDNSLCASSNLNGVRVALSSTALSPNLRVDGFGLLNTAYNWNSFLEAVRCVEAPPLNFLYADREGNIGHALAGKIPVRGQGDGLLPQAGWQSDATWQGAVPSETLPHALNPTQRYVVSANHKIMVEESPFLGNVWRNGYRARRIEEMIEGGMSGSMETAVQLQQDQLSLPALQLCRHLSTLQPAHPNSRFCLQQLQRWDGVLSTNSIVPTIYQTFLVHLTQATLKLLPQSLCQMILGVGGDENFQPLNDFQGQWIVTLLMLLESEDDKWLYAKSRAGLLLECLEKTAVTLNGIFGPDPAQWRWGNHHTLTYKHPLSKITPLDRIFDVGPVEVGGDSSTVQQTGIMPLSMQQFNFQNNGISVSTRMVVDVGNWNQFQLLHGPGQSGHCGHPNYDDLVGVWQRDHLLTMPWDEEEIREGTAVSLLLLPHK